MRKTLICFFIASTSLQAGDDFFNELFADPATRASAIQRLIPGSQERYFHTALDHQLAGRDAEFQKTISEWRLASSRKENAIPDTGLKVLEERQALMNYSKYPAASLKSIIEMESLKFDHSRKDAAAEAENLPTRLDPAAISDDAFEARAEKLPGAAGYRNYRGERLLRELETIEAFDEAKTRWFIDNLQRADLPGVVPLIDKALGFDLPDSFGTKRLHKNLTSDQLTSLLEMRPSLREREAFALLYLEKLMPGAEVNFQRDLKAHADHLQRCKDFVLTLPESMTSLKAHVLFHHLRLQSEFGNYPKEDFIAYLRLPRSDHSLLITDRKTRNPFVRADTNFTNATGCDPIGDDEVLIRNYLDRFLSTTDSAEDFAPFIQERVLANIHARSRLLAGGDQERWGKRIDPADFKILQEEASISFPPDVPKTSASDNAVSLEVEFKNTPEVLVRIYEIDLPAHTTSARDLDVSIDLDGLVPHHERQLKFSQPSLIKHRETIALPELTGAGAWIVEFVGGQVSARALIRKGRLNPFVETSATGSIVRLFDEKNRLVKNAAVHLGGQIFNADPAGAIVIPNAPNNASDRGIAVAGKLATPIELPSRLEEPKLTTAFYLDREQLLADREAKLYLRVQLANQGHELPLDRIENPALVLKAELVGGITTERVIAENLKLTPSLEIPFQVPADLLKLTLILRGTVTPLTGGEPIKLNDSKTYSVNSDLGSARVSNAFFSPTAEGYRIEIRGRNGEPMASRPIYLKCQHRDYQTAIQVQLRTDASGRIDLGKLDGIESIVATGNGITELKCSIPKRKIDYANDMQTRTGTDIRLPLIIPAPFPDRLHISLIETRGDLRLRDHFDKVKIIDGQIIIRGLPAGDFQFNQDGETTHIRVSSGTVENSLIVSAERIFPEHLPANPTIARAAAEGNELIIQLANSSPETRITVTGKRYYDPGWEKNHLAPFRPIVPGMVIRGMQFNGYLTDRILSEDLRYILDRRALQTFPGSMLPRPGLLLNRWSDEDLHQDTVFGMGGADGEAAGASPITGKPPTFFGTNAKDSDSEGADIRDFLLAPAVVRFQLKPAANGLLTLPLADFKDSQFIQISVNDSFASDAMLLPLPASDAPLRDRRIARPLDPGSHHLATRSAAVLKKGAEASIENLLDAEWRAFTTLTEAHQLLFGATGDDRLREFAFLGDWPDFSEKKKLELLSTHACHEFHLFLARKDKAFFDKHVKPLLAQKLEPKFIDDLLLGRDLKDYLRPFAWSQLNAAEKALLAQALPESRARISRELSLRWQLEAPAPDDETRLFTETLRGTDLATQDTLGLARNEYEESSSGVSYLTEKLRRIVIPRIDFEDTTVEEAIDFLRLRSAELDMLEADPSKKGINFVIRRPRTAAGSAGNAAFDPGNLRISELRVRNVPLAVALKYICDAAKLRYKVDDYSVTLVPQTETGEDLYTRTFSVPPDFASSLSPDSGISDPFADTTSKNLQARIPIVERLRAAGITFPEGSSATLSSNGKLLVTATPTELDKIEQLTEAGKPQGRPRSAPASMNERLIPPQGNAVDPFAAPEAGNTATLYARKPKEIFPNQTRLWRESNYYKSLQSPDGSLIPLNRFWIDLAGWDGQSPFLSAYFNSCTENANEALMCLALLDLPFKADRPEVTVDGSTLRVKAREPMLLFYKDTRRTETIAPESPLLVRQTYSPFHEPFRIVEGRKIENPVTGEFRPGVPYRASLVVTNPTGIGRRVDLLAQIPAGSIALNGINSTLSITNELQPYGVIQAELAFYFPAAGEFASYPLHVSEDSTILAHSEARTLKVTNNAAPQDAASWLALADDGTNEQVLKRLETENLNTIDLQPILWRLKDKPFFLAVSKLLRERLYFNEEIASFGLLHNDLPSIRDFFDQEKWLVNLGPVLNSPLLATDPVVNGGWETQEFDPLINPRAHRFGNRSRLTHEDARTQYDQFLLRLGWKSELSAADRLNLTAFLFLQDRIEEALARFDQIDPAKLRGRIQYDYLQAVVHFYREKPQEAKIIAERLLPTLPPGMWHDRFQSVIDQTNEILALNQPEQNVRPQSETIAPQLDLHPAGNGKLAIQHRGLKKASLRLFNVDLEVLFTKDPFLSGDGGNGTEPSIRPNDILEIPLAENANETSIDLPPALQKGNVLVSAESGSMKLLRILDSRAIEIRENAADRTVQVLDAATSKPLPKTYVKIYAKKRTGEIAFHKDGYTDLRGKFDYVSHTAVDVGQIESFAVLVTHPEKGARTAVYHR